MTRAMPALLTLLLRMFLMLLLLLLPLLLLMPHHHARRSLGPSGCCCSIQGMPFLSFKQQFLNRSDVSQPIFQCHVSWLTGRLP